MTARVQAAVLGTLIAVTAFIACVCLSAPAIVLAALFEIDDHQPAPWVRPGQVLMASLAVSSIAAVFAGRRVARDWYRAAHPVADAPGSPKL